MYNLFKSSVLPHLVIVSVLFLIGCKKDDPQPETPQLTGDTKQYALASVSNPAISGTVTLAKRNDNATVVTIQLNGTSAGASHPAHIHANTAAEGGAILLDLTNVDGASGRSETIVTKLNDGSDITYEQLLTIDGYINVHESAANLATIIAQGNIGANEVSYNVTNAGASDYVFNGDGLTNANDPTLTLKRGRTYVFNLNASGHPFFIKTAQVTGAADAYNDGVTNNGVAVGTIVFTVPADAPNTLFYICSIHSSMTGTINITD